LEKDIAKNDTQEVVQMVDFKEERYCDEETLEKNDVVENDPDRVMHVVDFEE
jgi:hypothetical protein